MKIHGKESLWPVQVSGSTHDEAGKRHRFLRFEDGAGDIGRAMLRAVLSQPHPALYLGTEIVAVTQLGQVCKRIFEVHFGKFCMVRKDLSMEEAAYQAEIKAEADANLG